MLIGTTFVRICINCYKSQTLFCFACKPPPRWPPCLRRPTILDDSNEELRPPLPPPPISMMAKKMRLLCANVCEFIINNFGGRGFNFFFVLFNTVAYNKLSQNAA